MKTCTQCGVEKQLENFWFHAKKNRHVAACNECAALAKKHWKDANKDRTKKSNREWQVANPEKTKEAHQRWVDRNPGIAKERARVWRKANIDRARAKQREINRTLKDAAYSAYGGYSCTCCGEAERAFLSIDHVNNDGADHRRDVNRRKIYKWLRDNGYPEGYQILCMNCNFGKARNGGVCPHKSKLATEGSTTIAQASTAKRPEARGSISLLRDG